MKMQSNSSMTSKSGTTKEQPTPNLHIEVLEPLCNECEEKTAVVRKRSWLYCAECWVEEEKRT